MDPSSELQAALVAALKADDGVAAIVAARVFDSVGANSTFPYLSIGPSQTRADHADGYQGSDVYLQIDAWSRKPGFVEVKQLAAAVRAALDLAEPAVTGFRLTSLSFASSQFMRDPDGLTSHGALSFRALLEPVA